MKQADLEVIKLLYFRFASFYGDKFTHNHPTDELVKLWWEDWYQGLAGIDVKHFKGALNHCMINLEWPPSLAEFRGLCEKDAGLPSLNEAYQAAIRDNFYHPLIKQIYDQIGSWAMRHDSEKDLKKKFKDYYAEELAKYRLAVQQEALKLSHKQKEVANDSQGSETSRDNIRRNGMRKAKDHLLSS